MQTKVSLYIMVKVNGILATTLLEILQFLVLIILHHLIVIIKNNFLVLGEGPTYEINVSFGTIKKEFNISFGSAKTNFCLSLHSSGDKSYLYVNKTKISKGT